ncbi:hypothetical protein BY996DRAFT_1519021 [Phakopsora pachyrhizi]|nr:hypothetical protein BY996DRAFT_1519021 [Phakopsora pachyrhizi]
MIVGLGFKVGLGGLLRLGLGGTIGGPRFCCFCFSSSFSSCRSQCLFNLLSDIDLVITLRLLDSEAISSLLLVPLMPWFGLVPTLKLLGLGGGGGGGGFLIEVFAPTVLTDVLMLVLDDDELLRTLRLSRSSKKFAVSMTLDEQLDLEIGRAGMAGFLTPVFFGGIGGGDDGAEIVDLF